MRFASLLLLFISFFATAAPQTIHDVSKITRDGEDWLRYSYTLGPDFTVIPNHSIADTGYCWVAYRQVVKQKGNSIQYAEWGPNGTWMAGMVAREIKKSCSQVEVADIQKVWNLPLSGSINHPIKSFTRWDGTYNNLEQCLIWDAYSSSAASPIYSLPITPSYCNSIEVPYVTVACQVTGDTILDHGSLTVDRVDGDTATLQNLLTCTDPTGVSLKVGSGNGELVTLRSDIKSRITVNDSAVSHVTVGRSLNMPITIKSQLIAAGEPQPGEFSGNTIITVEVD